MDFMKIKQDEKFHAISETHLATIFKQYGKYTKKSLYQIHARCLWNSVNKKRAQMWIFLCKKFYQSKKPHDIMSGCCNIFCNHDVWFYNSYKNYSKMKNDPLLCLDEWLGIVQFLCQKTIDQMLYLRGNGLKWYWFRSCWGNPLIFLS